MTRCMLATVAALALALSLAGGPGSLLGAAIASASALASLAGFALLGTGSRPLQRALAVFAAAFGLRLVLLALGVLWVVRSGWSVPAFVVAFFVPYFVFAAIEGLTLHALGRRRIA